MYEKEWSQSLLTFALPAVTRTSVPELLLDSELRDREGSGESLGGSSLHNRERPRLGPS